MVCVVYDAIHYSFEACFFFNVLMRYTVTTALVLTVTMAENWSFIIIIALSNMIIIIVYICAYSTCVAKCTVVCIVHFIYPIFRGGFAMYVRKITVFKKSVVFFSSFFFLSLLHPLMPLVSL